MTIEITLSKIWKRLTEWGSILIQVFMEEIKGKNFIGTVCSSLIISGIIKNLFSDILGEVKTKK